MSVGRRLKTATFATGPATLRPAGVAQAASLPQGAEAHSRGDRKHCLSLPLLNGASGKSIEGTVKATGGSCASKQPLRFNPKPNNKTPLAPGQ